MNTDDTDNEGEGFNFQLPLKTLKFTKNINELKVRAFGVFRGKRN